MFEDCKEILARYRQRVASLLKVKIWSKSEYIWNDDKEIMLKFQLKTQKLMICQIRWKRENRCMKRKKRGIEIDKGERDRKKEEEKGKFR